jgi:hypothetical protein
MIADSDDCAAEQVCCGENDDLGPVLDLGPVVCADYRDCPASENRNACTAKPWLHCRKMNDVISLQSRSQNLRAVHCLADHRTAAQYHQCAAIP